MHLILLIEFHLNEPKRSKLLFKVTAVIERHLFVQFTYHFFKFTVS